jgi:RimJ/RimL family protein N-acetyltransferase
MTLSVTFRLSTEADAPYLKKWLDDPKILSWFPMINEKEIDDAVRIWIYFVKQGAGITAEYQGEPCGMAVLNLQPFKKLAHQCLISIVVSENMRNKGIGTALMKELMRLAKETFKLESLHLEVYETNPAKHLYDRLGFTEFGRQEHFVKEKGEYLGKIMMESAL